MFLFADFDVFDKLSYVDEEFSNETQIWCDELCIGENYSEYEYFQVDYSDEKNEIYCDCMDANEIIFASFYVPFEVSITDWIA